MSETIGRGYYDQQGNACLTLHLRADGVAQGGTVDAIIDTGFTEFLQVPQELASYLRIVSLTGVPVTLADGSNVVLPGGIAYVTFMDVTHAGLVLMPPKATSILAGMKFLETFGLGLLISRSLGIALVPERLLADVFERMSQQPE